MKLLYAIQGTGNGHLSRARDIIPHLQHYGSLDLLVSGRAADVRLSDPVQWQFYGMSFTFGKDGGVDIWDTLQKANIGRFWRDMRQFPIQDYDLIINDFEPITAWAARRKAAPLVALSHQSAVVHPAAPRPASRDWLGSLVLRHYAPARVQYGFHFEAYAEEIFTPVIRQGIRALSPSQAGHYTVYLPAVGDERMHAVLSQIDVPWEVFSKHTSAAYTQGNVRFFPIQNEAFIRSLEHCTGLLCGAGFEAPAEALFLGKKLAVIPMTNQYEQHCNATALARMGVPVLEALSVKALDRLRDWVMHQTATRVDYPDQTAAIVKRVIETTF
ncbi:MAG: glycosyltransferase family protein [Bernardetiaceae bacterium]